MKKTPLISTVVLSLALAGCAAMTDDPRKKALFNDPLTKDFEDEVQNKRLSYLGRYLVETDTREKIVANVYDEEFLSSWSAADYATLSSMMTDLAVGQLGSSLGGSIGGAVAGAGLILGAVFSSDHDLVGQAWIPENFQGRKISSSEEAHAAFSDFIEGRMEHIGDTFGYEVICLSKCAERSKVFEFTRKEQPMHDKPYGYEPQSFVAVVNLSGKFERIEEEDILPVLVGEPVRWKLPPYYTLKMAFLEEPKRDESGNIVIIENETPEYTIEYVEARRGLLSIPFGRMVVQEFHSTPYTILGIDDIYPAQLFFNGEAYTFWDGASPEIIRDKVITQFGD